MGGLEYLLFGIADFTHFTVIQLFSPPYFELAFLRCTDVQLIVHLIVLLIVHLIELAFSRCTDVQLIVQLIVQPRGVQLI